MPMALCKKSFSCCELENLWATFDWIPHALFWTSSLSSASACAKVSQLICFGVASLKEMPEIKNEGGINVPLALSSAVEPARLVLTVFSLWRACCSLGSPCSSHFHSSLTTVLLNTEPPILPPPELHIPAP